MKVLLTGGAGFIGSHIADAYLAAGHEVVIVDNLSSGTLANLPRGVKFYLLDICSPEIERVFEIEKPEIVNHQAAQISVTLSSREPSRDCRINCQGMLNLLQICVRYKIHKLIFSSTGGALYGDTDRMPTPEDFPPQPFSPYGIHKLTGEHYLNFFQGQHGLNFTILRYANVYGPRQNPHGEAGVVAIFIDNLLRGEAPTIYRYPGDPDGMTRDYVYVGDVARANLSATQKDYLGVVNIGTGVSTTTGALYREIASVLGSNLEPLWEEPRPGELRKSCLEISRAKEVLDWAPRVSLQDGIENTINFFKS